MLKLRPLLAFVAVLFAGAQVHADWPAHLFAPYAYIGSEGTFKITDCASATGQKYFTLAFVIAGADKQPAWDGQIGMDKFLYAEQIAAIRKSGGDVIVSLGGEAGSELATVDDSVDSLQAKYQSIIDRYHFTWLDFDIEGASTANQAANHRRNVVLAKLQARDPALTISYTLPVDPDGLSGDCLKLLADAKAQGVRVRSANIMTMDFGDYYSKGKKMSDVAIASAEKTHEQLAKIDANLTIGLCPMIGQNDTRSEVFTLADAKALRDWADQHDWISSLSFWSVNRDTGEKKRNLNDSSKVEQKAWEFTGIFESFGEK